MDNFHMSLNGCVSKVALLETLYALILKNIETKEILKPNQYYIMTLTTLEEYVKREIFKTDKELFDFCPACDETGNTIEALMKGLFQEAKKLQKERDEILKINRSIAKSIEELRSVVKNIGNLV